MKAVLVPLFLLIMDSVCFSESFVYVSLRSDNRVSVYSEDEITGKLSWVASETVTGGPGSIAVTSDRHRMYIALRDAHEIACYSIDQKTGRLTFLTRINSVDNPVYIALDRTNRFLLSAYFDAAKLAVYAIGDDGGLQDRPVYEAETASQPHAVQVNSRNDALYVTCMGGDRILQYRFHQKAGITSALKPVVTNEKTGPRHFAFRPDGTRMFVANEVASSVTAYKVLATGYLVESQTLSSLPSDYSGVNKCADIHITPDGRFLYVSNRGADTIAAYRVSDDGALSLIGFFATEATPREMVIDAAGRYLFSVGESSGRLQSYRIDSISGALIPVQNLEIGNGPVWIESVKVD